MKFSIVTVTYNSDVYLAQALDSVLGQEEVELELLVVDGGSTDGTIDVIRRRAEADPRVRWVSEPDEGISDAFNKGIRMAGGEIVGILNSDDVYFSGALRAVAEAFSAHPESDVVHGDMLRFQGERKLFLLKPAPVDDRIWHDMPVNHPATFVRRSAYERVGLFDTGLKVAMDYELVLRLYCAGCRFHYLKRTLAGMRYGGASDERFLAARREVFRVTVAAGYPRWRAAGWFLLKTCQNMTKNLLRRTGLTRLLMLHPKFHPATKEE